MTDLSPAAQMRESAAMAARDYTPEKHSGMTLASHITGRTIEAAIRAIPLPPEHRVTVKPLVWSAVTVDRGDGSYDETGGFEADTPIGSYDIDIGFGSDCYYWSVQSPDGFDIGSNFDDPDNAKAAAQDDYDARILSAIYGAPTPVAASPADDPAVKALVDAAWLVLKGYMEDSDRIIGGIYALETALRAFIEDDK